MATQTIMNTRIQFRRDIAANWAAVADTVMPAAGEPCFETDTGVFKIGDGVKTYGELEALGNAEISADGKSIIINGEGAIELAGFADAETNAQPYKKDDGTIGWVVPSTESVEGLQTTVATLQADVDNLKAIVTPSEEGATALDERVDALETAVETLNGDSTTEGSIKKIVTDEIDAFAANISDDGKVNTLKELVDYVAKHGGEVATMAADIASLQSIVKTKVDKEEGKGLSSNDFTGTLLDKLNAIEEGAQVNKIESITIGGTVADGAIAGGTLLDIINKGVNIPVAGTTLGLVKSYVGDEYNKVIVDEDGTMTVNKIDVSALYVPEDTELVLDGGSSAILDGGGAAG